jgi:glucose/arabinose dehydrogenase
MRKRLSTQRGAVALGLLATGLVAALITQPASAGAPLPGITPATELPPGFSDEALFSLNNPTAIAFAPARRMLITTDAGRLRVAVDGVLESGPALNLSNRICSNGERGMLGVAVDPEFSSNKFIYVFWTFNKHDRCPEGTNKTPVNRVSRYKLGNNNVVVDGSGKVIVDNIPSPATNHNAGDLHFGANGFLYISTGDGGCEIGEPALCGADNDNSLRLDIPNGKILRVKRNGSVPASNPFVGDKGDRTCTDPAGVSPGTGPCTETFAHGFRNPFRFAIYPGLNIVFANDVGQSTWEEIDRVQPGRDYGWNVREGFCVTGSSVDCTPDPQFTDPQYAYDRNTDCRSITGAAFVPVGTWGAPYDDSFLFADFTCNSVFRLVPQKGTAWLSEPFFPADAPVELTFGPGPDGRSLYYLEYWTGEVHRVAGSTT